MDLDHLAILRAELARLHQLLARDLSAPIAHCGDWTMRDLAEHVGRENLWSAVAVRERRGDYAAPPAPDDVVGWFAETSAILVEALGADPATEAWTFHPPHTVGFWRRRRCLETLVHRWDAENALGDRSPLDPELCGDGIAEVIEVFVPRQMHLGRMAPPHATVRFAATDLDTTWTLGSGTPVATLHGTAEDLLLALWNRRPMPWATLTGDAEAARQALRGPLVP